MRSDGPFTVIANCWFIPICKVFTASIDKRSTRISYTSTFIHAMASLVLLPADIGGIVSVCSFALVGYRLITMLYRPIGLYNAKRV